MTKDDEDAMVILEHAIDSLPGWWTNQDPDFEPAEKILRHAIRHLAYPDRGVYPKVRHATKSKPVRLG